MTTVVDEEDFFRPTQIPGCQLWLDAVDPNGTGTAPPIGSAISSWVDKSTNNRTLTTTTAGTGSVRYISYKGYPAVLFNSSGVNTAYMRVVNAVNLTNLTVFGICLSQTALSNQNALLAVPASGFEYSSTDAFGLFIDSQIPQDRFYANGSGTPVQNTTTSSGGDAYPRRIVAYTCTSAGVLSSFLNGTAGNTSSGGARAGTATGFGIGFDISMPSGSPVNLICVSQFYEFIVYNAVLSEAQRQQVEGYLAWKWGMQGSLPASHPYKNSVLAPLLNPPITRAEIDGSTFFNPTQVSGLTLWLDASDITTMRFTGTSITNVRDKSPANITLSNASGYQYRRAAFNNAYPSFFSDAPGLGLGGAGSANTLGVNASLALTTPFTFFFVAHQTVALSGVVPYGYLVDSAGGVSRSYIYRADTATPFGSYGGVTFYGSPSIGTFGWVTGTNTSYIVANGSNLSAVTGTLGALTTDGITIGNRFTLTEAWPGHICEVLIYTQNVSLTERQQIEGYLAWKWGLQSQLPSYHPYKTSILPPLLNPSNLPPQITSAFWIPTRLANCILWFDAADTSTITTTGTTVTNWRSKGTLSVSATPAIPSPRTEATGTVSSGNKGYVTFNTTNLNCVFFPGLSYLGILNVATTQKSRVQAFIFSVTAYGDGYSRIMCSADLTSTNQVGFNAWNRDGNSINTFPAAFSGSEFLGVGGQPPYSGTLPYNGTPFIIVWEHSTSVTENYISANGTRLPLSVSQALVNGYFTGTNNFLLGCGPGYSNAQVIGEVIQYDGGLSDIQLAQLEGYLAWKWGLVANLPSNHLYKLYPPPP